MSNRLGSGRIGGGGGLTLPIAASDVVVSPSVRGESDLQLVLEASIPILLEELTPATSTTLPPGDVYASDTRVYEAGLYHLVGTTFVSASNNNTQVYVGFRLDGFDVPLPWTDTPSSTGDLYVTLTNTIALTAGPHTIEVTLGRASGTGDARALASVLCLTRVG